MSGTNHSDIEFRFQYLRQKPYVFHIRKIRQYRHLATVQGSTSSRTTCNNRRVRFTHTWWYNIFKLSLGHLFNWHLLYRWQAVLKVSNMLHRMYWKWGARVPLTAALACPAFNITHQVNFVVHSTPGPASDFRSRQKDTAESTQWKCGRSHSFLPLQFTRSLVSHDRVSSWTNQSESPRPKPLAFREDMYSWRNGTLCPVLGGCITFLCVFAAATKVLPTCSQHGG